MKGIFRIANDVGNRTIRLRMTGEYDLSGMQRLAQELRRATDEYANRSHLILADMRGMLPLAPEVAHVFGELIAYTRHHGVVRCAHLSDDTVQKLQASRLGRQSTPKEDLTVNVASLDEAERVLAEMRAKL
ncbi:MAG: hypothetical protein DIU78_000250 [Pseudomonadota bacterium]|nr:MAG: hypothetical protein DIU78_07065 [Pseudomonadota bacterium]